jgi:creatinine amidohydrolase
MSGTEREIRMEMLRPRQLNEEQALCPLVFVPIGPLEYHGPHLPVGMDAINATQCALETCRRLGKGVVHPTLFCGTERERPGWMLESLGFGSDDWIVGMDFPTALWKSHYYAEHLFALAVSGTVEMLIGAGYRIVFLVNGHGAWNHRETLERLARHYSHATEASVVWRMAFTLEVSEEVHVGHADLCETSLMMHYQEQVYGREDIVDIGQLPRRQVPLHYRDFSVVDGAGFSRTPSPDTVVRTDPRDSTAAIGRTVFGETVDMLVRAAADALRSRGS